MEHVLPATRLALYARKSSESEERQILSIDSQVTELSAIATRLGFRVHRVFTEAASAKAPGRPVFNDLIRRVQEGEFDAILCWKVDRLARNPVDGGAVIWALEERKLAAIHTPQRSFTNTGNDKFWMQLEFGMAKKYVDDLSDNVKRGIRAKLAQGWWPGVPPIGYLNDQVNHTIVKDPDRFSLIRRMWELMLTGLYTPPQIHAIATHKWGLRTRVSRRMGGGPMARAAVYKMFTNPFYHGVIEHLGERYQGAHPPMVTRNEFKRVQEILARSSRPRSQGLSFTFAGLLRCGACGAAVTAERKRNRHGTTYTYYHCTHRKQAIDCRQRAVETGNLEQQIVRFLASLTMPKEVHDLTLQLLDKAEAASAHQEEQVLQSLRQRRDRCERERSELVSLRLRGLLGDEEFSAKKRELESEQEQLEAELHQRTAAKHETYRQCQEVFQFALTAKRRFETGSDQTKRAILGYVGSNPFLLNKKLCIQALEPLERIREVLAQENLSGGRFEPLILGQGKQRNRVSTGVTRVWRGLVDDVRTFFYRKTGLPTFKQTLAWSKEQAVHEKSQPAIGATGSAKEEARQAMVAGM